MHDHPMPNLLDDNHGDLPDDPAAYVAALIGEITAIVTPWVRLSVRRTLPVASTRTVAMRGITAVHAALAWEALYAAPCGIQRAVRAYALSDREWPVAPPWDQARMAPGAPDRRQLRQAVGWRRTQIEALYLDLIVLLQARRIPSPAVWLGHALCITAPPWALARAACSPLPDRSG